MSLAAMIFFAIEKIIFFNISNMPGNKFYETIFKGVIFGSFFGTAFFGVDGLLKLAHDQNKLNRKMISQLKDYEKELSQCEEKLLQCEEKLSQCKEAIN